MKIKNATIKDFDTAYEYIKKLWDYNTYDYETTKEVYEKVLQDENSFAFFSIEDDGTFHGFCHGDYFQTFWMSGLTCYVSSLITNEEDRGKGYGVNLLDHAKKLAKERGCKAGVYGASTTGEETTKTGAYWTSTRINPTMAIVVDVTYASDYNGMDPAETGTVLLGDGPVLCNSPIVVKALNAKMEECAKEAGIPVQREAASRLTYTDGDKIHFSNQGVPMVLVSIPLRYMHMPAEVADEKDVEGCIELIAEFLVKCV